MLSSKISYLISKYKNYLINIYEKVKSNLVCNNCPINNKKFSVVDDIFKFIKNYNNKYHSNININLIIQANDDEKSIIYKVCNYILDMFYDLDGDEDEHEVEDSSIKTDGYIYEKKDFVDSESDNDSIDNNDSDSDILKFDEFFPKKKSIYIKNKKRTYNEIIDQNNELIRFWDSIFISQNSLKNH